MSWPERERVVESSEEKETFREAKALEVKQNSIFILPSMKTLVPYERFPSGGRGGRNGGGSAETVFVISAFGALIDAAAFVFVKFFVSTTSALLAPLFGSAIIFFIIATLAFMAIKR